MIQVATLKIRGVFGWYRLKLKTLFNCVLWPQKHVQEKGWGLRNHLYAWLLLHSLTRRSKTHFVTRSPKCKDLALEEPRHIGLFHTKNELMFPAPKTRLARAANSESVHVAHARDAICWKPRSAFLHQNSSKCKSRHDLKFFHIPILENVYVGCGVGSYGG